MERSHFQVVISRPPTLQHLRWRSASVSLAKISMDSAWRHSMSARILESGGEFRAVRGVTAGVALDVFGEEVAFGYGDVTQQISEGELIGGVRPVDFIGRNAAGYAHGAFADVGEIF